MLDQRKHDPRIHEPITFDQNHARGVLERSDRVAKDDPRISRRAKRQVALIHAIDHVEIDGLALAKARERLRRHKAGRLGDLADLGADLGAD